MKRMLFAALALLATVAATFAAPIKVLIVDGQNNHDWKTTTPVLKKYLEETGLFTVDVATTPPGPDVSSFNPKFDDYAVVVSNYNGAPWSTVAQAAFEKFVKNGGGFVSVHAADNAFPNWQAYNEMIGVGGWAGRNEKNGPHVHVVDGKVVRETNPGPGGHHGQQHPFVIETLDSKHPITAGLPTKWMHAQDELYDTLRGPAENMTVLATAYSDPKTGGTGRNEPILMVLKYGQGRVFHTVIGHSMGGTYQAMQCTGFIATFQRGTEWAATGKVTQKVPADFPTATEVRFRK